MKSSLVKQCIILVIMCIKFVLKKLLQISEFWIINVQLVHKTALLKHRPWDLNSKTRLRTIFLCNSTTYPCTGLFYGFMSCLGFPWQSFRAQSYPYAPFLSSFPGSDVFLLLACPTLFPNSQTDVNSLIAGFMSSLILYLMGLCTKSHPEKLGESVLALPFQIPSLHGNTEFFLAQMAFSWFGYMALLEKYRKLVLGVNFYSQRDYITFLFLSS